MAHPNVVNLADLDERQLPGPELRGRRVRVGPAAGAHRCGLSLYRLGPGERAMPVHVHADEEEHFFVLAGDGLSWQDGRTYRVSAGDCLVHLARGAAHTIVAGAQGMEVLAFGTGSDTGMTWLPRARAWWMGPHWIPSDGPDPFEAETLAGPLELPEPQDGPAPHSSSLARATERRSDRPGYRESHRRLAEEAGSARAGLHHATLAPGELSCPQHWHSAEEEAFVVLDGDGQALLDDETHPLRPGDVLWRPPGQGVAHALRAGGRGMTYLVFGTRVPDDYCFYPRSGKLNFAGVIFRPEPLDYWDGEAPAGPAA
ncbi:MAG TPA: cupin domain-containing protein [Solirubrobacteraceae bacterium]|nr:cupin domain-containing protein [Solirubrobacteraceae bacterium]